MIIEYSIKSIKIGKTRVKYIPEFEDDTKLILTHFLCSEVPMFSGKILDSIQAVISGKSEFREFAGNSCELIVNRTNSVIRGNVEGMEICPECIINTNELRDLIVCWLDDLKTLKKN